MITLAGDVLAAGVADTSGAGDGDDATKYSIVRSKLRVADVAVAWCTSTASTLSPGTSTPAAPQALQGGWLNQSGSDSSGGGGSSHHTIPPPTAAAFEQQQHMRTSCRCPSAPATSQSTRQGRWTCGQDRAGSGQGRQRAGRGGQVASTRPDTRAGQQQAQVCVCRGGSNTQAEAALMRMRRPEWITPAQHSAPRRSAPRRGKAHRRPAGSLLSIRLCSPVGAHVGLAVTRVLAALLDALVVLQGQEVQQNRRRRRDRTGSTVDAAADAPSWHRMGCRQKPPPELQQKRQHESNSSSSTSGAGCRWHPLAAAAEQQSWRVLPHCRRHSSAGTEAAAQESSGGERGGQHVHTPVHLCVNLQLAG